MSAATRVPGAPVGESVLGLGLRMPPTNLHAEQALLGAILANAKAWHAVSDFLEPKHFADPVHQAIYTAMGRIVAAGGVPDGVLLARHFADSPVLEPVGGNNYIAQLLACMVGIINAKEYARAIAEDWVRREMIDAGEMLVNGAFDRTVPVTDLLAETMRVVDATSIGGSGRAPAVSLNAAMDEALARAERAASGKGRGGTLTGFPSLDRVYNGLLPGTLHVKAGRPGMGKSALGWQIAIHAGLACRDKIGEMRGGVFVQSLEMGAGELGERALSAFSSVPAELMQQGKHQFYRSALAMAREELNDLPLDIDETASLNMHQIAIRAREAHRKFGGLALILVDHLHIIAHDADTGRRQFGPTQAVGQISSGLKKLAKDLRCPVLALAQLNRGVEAREDKRPTLSDLRQSGDIEQDADSVSFIYRPEYYLPKGDPEQKPGEPQVAWQARVRDYDEQKARLAGKAEVILEKVRGGRPQLVRLNWEAETTSFIDPAA